MPSTGPLIDLKVNGKSQPGMVSINKSSLFFELNRNDGKPLFKVEERPVPKGDVPGEYYSPTQPFPTQTPPLSKMSMTKADIVTAADTDGEHAAACQAMWDKAGGYRNDGPYTPFYFHKEGDPPRSNHSASGWHGRRQLGRPCGRSDQRYGVRRLAGNLAGRLDREGSGRQVLQLRCDAARRL